MGTLFHFHHPLLHLIRPQLINRSSFESNRTLGIRTLDSILNHSLSTFGARNKWFAQLPSLARSNNCLHLHSAASTDFLASNTAHAFHCSNCNTILHTI